MINMAHFRMVAYWRSWLLWWRWRNLPRRQNFGIHQLQSYQIPPAEIEVLIQQHPTVLEVAVMAATWCWGGTRHGFYRESTRERGNHSTNIRNAYLNICQLFLSYLFLICLSCKIFGPLETSIPFFQIKLILKTISTRLNFCTLNY